MGNVNGREEEGEGGGGGVSEGDVAPNGRSNGGRVPVENHAPNSYAPGRAVSHELMSSTPPASPTRSRSPLVFAPQIPVASIQRSDGPPIPNQSRQNEAQGIVAHNPEGGIPTIIAWNYGGNDVAVEGSWDNWTSRKILQRSGKDYSILLVLPSGIYHYKFIVDGECRYSPDLPHTSDEMGSVCNLLDVQNHIPENLESVGEFEAPPSPDSSYSRVFPAEEDFAKEPAAVPPPLHLSFMAEDSAEAASLKPQHVVLNHLFLEKGRTPQSVVALGLTHRFQSKYVTVVLYKPLKR